MIIWIASYPKSGNTWVRLFLENYFSKIKNNFYFDGFPNHDHFKKLNINHKNFKEIINNWKMLQDYQNLNSKINILKTHNALCTIGKNKFTTYENTLGAIYLVRDPRDVVVSYSNHLGINVEEVTKKILDPYACEIMKVFNDEISYSLMSTWSNHYNSWLSDIGREFLIIKYEDLVNDTKNQFIKILEYLNKICNTEIDEIQLQKSLEETSFKNLKKKEELYGFDQASGNGPFFRKGIIGDWKNTLKSKIVSKIENSFDKEMKKLGYKN